MGGEEGRRRGAEEARQGEARVVERRKDDGEHREKG
jgi:hypothetical protein